MYYYRNVSHWHILFKDGLIRFMISLLKRQMTKAEHKTRNDWELSKHPVCMAFYVLIHLIRCQACLSTLNCFLFMQRYFSTSTNTKVLFCCPHSKIHCYLHNTLKVADKGYPWKNSTTTTPKKKTTCTLGSHQVLAYKKKIKNSVVSLWKIIALETDF